MDNVDISTTKQKILQSCFRLFTQKNLDRVTVKDIELAVGITRGSIFYHFVDKIDIFRNVMDSMYFTHFNDGYFSDIRKPDTLESFITCYMNPCQRIVSFIKKAQPDISSEKAFLHLTSQANIYYTNFSSILEEHLTNEEIRVATFLKSNYSALFPDKKLNAISILLTDRGYSQILRSAFGISKTIPTSNLLNMFLP